MDGQAIRDRYAGALDARIGQASAPVRLTRTSTLEVQELAFFYVGDVPSKG